jgi:hypothetical protein
MTARLALSTLAAAALAGCAAMNSVDSDVASYGSWPAGRAPGSYCFERLPSQQARPEQQAQLEMAARSALAKAGFTPAASDTGCDVSVQLGARITRYDRSPWDDPFWWRWGAWGPGHWRHPGFYPFGYHGFYSSPVYDREVAILLRDRKGGTPLYEARATNDGSYAGGTALLAAMFEAALKDFPTPAVNPRRVTVQLPSAA